MSSSTPQAPATDRRAFLKEAAAGVVGGCCMIVPAAAGLVAWLDPLARDASGTAMVRVAALEALPPDGTPRRVTVVAGKRDGWTREPDVPLGAIYLRRTAKDKVVALHSVCPHAGCFVDYQAERKSFFCPCHDSTFAMDGSINDPKSPSPRPMDTLQVEVKGDDVWVRFVQYRTGIKEKVEVT